MASVLYLHGFASSPAGRKVARLRELLPEPDYRVVAPDLNCPSFERLEFGAMADAAVAAAVEEEPAVVLGSSLGALVALEAARRGILAPLVLVAPALGFGARWTEKLPPGDPVTFFHHGAERDIGIHRRFFDQMAALGVEREPPAQRVTVLMGEKDESVPFDGVVGVWRRWEASGKLAAGSRFVALIDGDHGLLSFVDRIAEAVREAAV